MAEAVTLEVVVGDLGDQFRTQDFPTQVLAGAPSALTAGDTPLHVALADPRMIGCPVLPVGLEHFRELFAPGNTESRCHADVLEPTRVIEQPEEQRADTVPVLVPTESGDDAVRTPNVLHLQHDPLARLVGLLPVLHDHAVQSGALET